VTAFSEWACTLADLDTSNVLLLPLHDPYVTSLVGNRFLYGAYWDGRPRYQSTINDNMRDLRNALAERRVADALVCVFRRIVVLRNQIVHGSAAQNTRRNRDAVEPAIRVLSALLRVTLELMIEKGRAATWNPVYPALGTPRHPWPPDEEARAPSGGATGEQCARVTPASSRTEASIRRGEPTGRTPQAAATRGSQRWIQALVNKFPAILDGAIGRGRVDWRSPLASDEFAEYQDAGFLDRLGMTLSRRALDAFWPSGGPRWDALGRAEDGSAVLVEAKAHLGELASPPSRATDESLVKIRRALEEVAQDLGARPGSDWTVRFYQFTNRLAHAHLLQRFNSVPTQLVFLYFVGDGDMNGPETRREWEAALAVLEEVLGLRGRMPAYVTHAFVDVSGPIPVIAA
jgi:hypothetical protein